jgi:thymidine kinase
MDRGRIELIIGCMFSGKSTELIRKIRKYQVLKKKILVINHSLDNRYGKHNIITHNKQENECVSTNNLLSLLDTTYYKESYIIVIEEAQFFKDLYAFTTYAADNDNKTVIVAGLDGDFKRQKFGDILSLIPHAESVTKLHALCLKCNDGTKAYFTKRINKDNTSQTYVGTHEDYVAVCRYHFNQED